MSEQTCELEADLRDTCTPRYAAASSAARYARAWQLAVEIEALVSTPEGRPLVELAYGGRIALALTHSLIEELEPLLGRATSSTAWSAGHG